MYAGSHLIIPSAKCCPPHLGHCAIVGEHWQYIRTCLLRGLTHRKTKMPNDFADTCISAQPYLLAHELWVCTL